MGSCRMTKSQSCHRPRMRYVPATLSDDTLYNGLEMLDHCRDDGGRLHAFCVGCAGIVNRQVFI